MDSGMIQRSAGKAGFNGHLFHNFIDTYAKIIRIAVPFLGFLSCARTFQDFGNDKGDREWERSLEIIPS